MPNSEMIQKGHLKKTIYIPTLWLMNFAV